MNMLNITTYRLNQFVDKDTSTANVKFIDLIRFIKFSERQSIHYDPLDPPKPIDKISKDLGDQYYQRVLNSDKTKKISKYLLKSILNQFENDKIALGIFPTSVILAINTTESESKNEFRNYISKSESENISVELLSFKKSVQESTIELTIPYSKSVLIVDGQHRLAGMLRLYQDSIERKIKLLQTDLFSNKSNLNYTTLENLIENFEFPCTFLIDFDLWEQGRVFADVNFNQKPVNKSVYYDIFGSYPDPEKNDIYLAHMLALHLNSNKKSPLKGFIKMLGRGDGFFSQAFFVESVIKYLFASQKIWYDIPMDYLGGGSKHQALVKIFRAYFTSLKINFIQFWPAPNNKNSRDYKHIMCKTTGIGALLRLMDPLFRSLQLEQNISEVSEKRIEEKLTISFSKISKYGAEYFSSDSEFAGAGSHGLQTALFKRIKRDLKV